MMVRCGSCRSQFDAPGPGRYACPACGSVNMIRDAGGAAPPPANAPGGYPSAPGVQPGGGMAPPPPPPPETPVAKITCPECDFSFYAGEVAVVVCPNCTSEIPTGLVDAPEREKSVPASDSEEPAGEEE